MDFLNKILTFFKEIFSNPFIISAFQGIGTSVADKILNKSKKPTKIPKENKATNPIVQEEPSPIQKDIQIIENSINRDLSYRQQTVYLRFFHKYKHHFSPEDIASLNEKSSMISPNYSNLLSELLGLIESTQE